MKRRVSLVLKTYLYFLVLLPSCSPVMEVTRPDPVDISQFSVGEDRTRVTQVLGPPQATVKQES